MVLDDLVLAVQGWTDRLIRRLRLGPRPERTHPRFVVAQIDGLSRSVLEQALRERHMPFVARLLERRQYALQAMAVGMPTSTPAFQMAAMYGVRPDIPGFHYYDKRRREDVHFPRPGHAARIEEQQARDHPGILRGGSVYGCVFTGGAEHNIFSFARLRQPCRWGLFPVVSALGLLVWVTAKSLVLTIVELLLGLVAIVAAPRQAREHWEWLKIKVGLSVWVRELFTLAASRDIYAGLPAIYVNFLDYDVAAHSFGPRDRRAFRALERTDAALRQLWRAVRRVPEHHYDFFILSDHGQAASRHYDQLVGGTPIQHRVFDDFLAPDGARAPAPGPAKRPGFAHGLRSYRVGETPMTARFVRRREPATTSEDPEAHEQGGVRVIAAGPNAFLYVVDTSEALMIEELDVRFPGLAEGLSRSPGVGFVLARSARGPVCIWRGARCQLGPSALGPFAGRQDLDVVLSGVADLMAMPSVGDLVIYGTDAPGGTVSFIPERGAHAGPAPDELHTFIIHPQAVALPTPIEHPLELYKLFSQYQQRGGGASR